MNSLQATPCLTYELQLTMMMMISPKILSCIHAVVKLVISVSTSAMLDTLMWNTLPTDIKRAATLLTFKTTQDFSIL